MANQARGTPWRQGALLHQNAVEALGLCLPQGDPAGIAAVVISHDCDLVQPAKVEPKVEIIPGCRIARPDGNYTHGKNPRRLHLPVASGATATWVELDARRKRDLEKQDLASHQPDASYSLAPHAKSILQRWLAARYRRAALPDEFNDRLSRTGLAARLARIMDKSGALISAVFFDLDNGEELVRTDADDPYGLVVYLLYSTRADPDAAAEAAEGAKVQIEQAFRQACYDADRGRWQQIELLDCLPVSDQVLTVAQSEMLKRWNADYISLRADPPQKIIND